MLAKIVRMPCTVVHRPRQEARERLLLIGGFNQDFYDALKRTDLLVEEVLEGHEALALVPRQKYGVVLCSLRMQGAWGLDVLDAILKADPLTPVIMSTHEQSPKVIVEAMQRGAFDYVIEPYTDNQAVLRIIERAVRRRASLRRGRALREALSSHAGQFFDELVGDTAPLREMCERIRQVAGTPSPVLIEGESGSGKELVARAIHQASKRHGAPFVAVHCGAIPESLLESELFGHEKGAFTGADSTRVGFFEEAHGGTLFLDEIGLAPRSCQGKLLRVLEGGVIRRVGASREFQVDVRIVAATNEPLQALVEARNFRQDLFYRLNVFAIAVPPLRERAGDIPLLSHHFAQRFAESAGKPFEAFSQEALRALGAFGFPGNIRELRNVVERAVVLSRGPVIGLADLPEHIRGLAGGGPRVEESPNEGQRQINLLSLHSPGIGLDRRLELIEKALIEHALQEAKGNRTRAAAALKVNRTTLLQKMIRLKLAPRPKDPASPKTRARKPRRAKPARRS